MRTQRGVIINNKHYMTSITPKWFPWEYIKNIMTDKKLLVNKVGIDVDNIVTYLCWDWEEYSWLSEYQLTSDSRRTVWFTIETKNP